MVSEQVSGMIALINRETTGNPEKRSPDPIYIRETNAVSMPWTFPPGHIGGKHGRVKDVAKLWERKEKNGMGMCHLRARVPKDLSDCYKREHVKKSLKTKDRRKSDISQIRVDHIFS